MQSKMTTQRTTYAIQPDIAGAYIQFFFYKLFLFDTCTHYDTISHTTVKML